MCEGKVRAIGPSSWASLSAFFRAAQHARTAGVTVIERRAKRATVLPRESRGRKDVIAGEIDRIEREWGLKP